MAATTVGVFGKPITEGSRTQRAQAAKNTQNSDGKHDQMFYELNRAAEEVANLSVTFVMIYNATGETVTYVTPYDWQGMVTRKYPVNIENGQWVMFKHASTRGQGSVGAVVYNIKDCGDSMIAWNNPWKTDNSENNSVSSCNFVLVRTRHNNNWKVNCGFWKLQAYCEMKDSGYFDDGVNWDDVYEILKDCSCEYETRKEDYYTFVKIDARGNTPSYFSILEYDG